MKKKILFGIGAVIGILGIILISGCIDISHLVDREPQILNLTMSSDVIKKGAYFSPNREGIANNFPENSEIYACGKVVTSMGGGSVNIELYKNYLGGHVPANISVRTLSSGITETGSEGKWLCANLSHLLSPGKYSVKFSLEDTDDKIEWISFNITGISKQPPEPVEMTPSEIITSGPVNKETVIELASEDKVAFFFLHNPGCGHCTTAEKHLPEIQEMFGQRMVIYKLKIRESESQPWTNIGVRSGLSSFPFTLAVGVNSVGDNQIHESKIGMTSSSGSKVYLNWKKNICTQFKNPPDICTEHL